jgi:hypothetical protein
MAYRKLDVEFFNVLELFELTPIPAMSGLPVKEASSQNSLRHTLQIWATCDVLMKPDVSLMVREAHVASSTSDKLWYWDGTALRSIANPRLLLSGLLNASSTIHFEFPSVSKNHPDCGSFTAHNLLL